MLALGKRALGGRGGEGRQDGGHKLSSYQHMCLAMPLQNMLTARACLGSRRTAGLSHSILYSDGSQAVSLEAHVGREPDNAKGLRQAQVGCLQMCWHTQT